MMTIEEFAEIKEKMIIAKEQGDTEKFNKYYRLVENGYEELTGKNFKEEMIKKASQNSEKEL